jgi:phage baseplate assembly protein W
VPIRDQNSDFLGTGWAFPITPAGGRLATLSDEALIKQSILLILQTAKGERVMEPEFGCDLQQLVFAADNQGQLHLAQNAVQTALQTWEPRIKVLAVTVTPAQSNPACLLIGVDYMVRAFNSRANLVYPFYLE